MEALFGTVTPNGTGQFWWLADDSTWRVLPVVVDVCDALRGVLEGKDSWMGHPAERKPASPDFDESTQLLMFCVTHDKGGYAIALRGESLDASKLSDLWGARLGADAAVRAATQAPTPREISTCLFEAIQVAFGSGAH